MRMLHANQCYVDPQPKVVRESITNIPYGQRIWFITK
jgi:hypothetical protein